MRRAVAKPSIELDLRGFRDPSEDALTACHCRGPSAAFRRPPHILW